MLLMVEKYILGGVCHTIHRYAKANKEYMNGYNKINNLYILNTRMQIINNVTECCKGFQ